MDRKATEDTREALKTIAKTGRKILFVATKKQAKDVVAEKAASINMPSERIQETGCTGCGRCSRACPVDMNILEHLISISSHE